MHEGTSGCMLHGFPRRRPFSLLLTAVIRARRLAPRCIGSSVHATVGIHCQLGARYVKIEVNAELQQAATLAVFFMVRSPGAAAALTWTVREPV